MTCIWREFLISSIRMLQLVIHHPSTHRSGMWSMGSVTANSSSVQYDLQLQNVSDFIHTHVVARDSPPVYTPRWDVVDAFCYSYNKFNSRWEMYVRFTDELCILFFCICRFQYHISYANSDKFEEEFYFFKLFVYSIAFPQQARRKFILYIQGIFYFHK